MSGDRTPFGGEDFADIEERLRVALAQEAHDVEPGDRLDDIRAEVGAGARGAGRPRWLGPVGAAAAVAAIAVVAWLGLRPGTAPLTPVAPNTATALPSTSSVPTATTTVPTATSTVPTPTTTVPTATTTVPTATSTVPTRTTSVTTSPAPPSSANPPAPPATTSFALPAYFVQSYAKDHFGLVREYIGTQLPVGADAAAQGAAALNVSLNAQPYTNTDGYLQLWPSGTTAKVTVTVDDIQVVLSGPGVAGPVPEQQRIAVQQVVWAVTAGVQKNLPVRISVASGANIFDTMPPNVYKRPAADTAFMDLAPIWVDSPSRDQVLPAGALVIAKGQACTFEANVQWELKQGAKVVRSGHTTASSGCPTQGSWSVDLGTPTAGTYTFRAFELRAADGSVRAQKVVSFSVR